MPLEQLVARDRLARTAAIAARPLPLRGLAALLRVPRAEVVVERIAQARIAGSARVVPVALQGVAGRDGARAVLSLPLPLARGIVDLALGRNAAEGGELTSGEEGALLFALDRAGGDWLAAGGNRFSVSGILADADQTADYLGGGPAWAIEARLVAGPLDGPLWVWSKAPARDPLPTRAASGSGRRDLPVSWRIVAGFASVPAAELAGLAAGDAVELDGLDHPLAPGPTSGLRLVSGSVARRARWLDRRRLELVSTDERRSAMAGNPEESTGVTARLEDPLDPQLGAMEVLLQVEIGRVSITLDRATALLAGSVLELDRDVGSEVQLRAGDRLVARGELVECEGRLAVQITEVS